MGYGDIPEIKLPRGATLLNEEPKINLPKGAVLVKKKDASVEFPSDNASIPLVSLNSGSVDIGNGAAAVIPQQESNVSNQLVPQNELAFDATKVIHPKDYTGIELLTPIEKKNFDTQVGARMLAPKDQKIIVDEIISNRNNPVVIYNNGKSFLEQDIDAHLSAIEPAINALPYGQEINKGLDEIKKDVLDEGEPMVNGTIPSIAYATERKKQIDQQINDLRNTQYSNRNSVSVTPQGNLVRVDNFDEIQKQIDQLSEYRNKLTEHTDPLAKVQIFKSTKEKPVDANDPNFQITNHWGEVVGTLTSAQNLYRNIGLDYAALYDPITVENKKNSIATGGDKLKWSDNLAIENYGYEKDGLLVSLDALDILKAQGKIAPEVYDAEVGKLKKNYNELSVRYPQVRIQNIKGALGQILDENRDKENKVTLPNGQEFDKGASLKSLWQNIVHTGYGDDEVQKAIDELNAKGANITKQEADFFINSKSDLGNTSVLGRAIGGLAKTSDKLLTTVGLESDAEHQMSQTLLDKRFSNTPNKAIEQPQTIINTEGNATDNPNFLKPVVNPKAGLHNWGWGTVNLVADGVGTLAKLYALTQLTGGAADALFGQSAGAEVVGYAADAKTGQLAEQTVLSAAQKSTFGTVSGMYLDTYQDAKDAAKNFIGEKEGGEQAREAYANLMGMVNGVAWTILPADKIVQDIAAKTAVVGAEDFAKLIPENGLAGLKENTVKDFLVNTLTNTAKAQGKMESISAITQVAQYAAQSMFNPQSIESRNLGQEVVDGALQGLSFLPITLMEGRGMAKGINDVNEFQKEAIYRVSSDPTAVKENLERQVSEGNLSQQSLNGKMEVVNTMFDIRKEVPQDLTKPEKIEYANNLLFTRKLHNENETIKDPVQTKINDAKILELEKRREEIINNSTGKIPTSENISSPSNTNQNESQKSNSSQNVGQEVKLNRQQNESGNLPSEDAQKRTTQEEVTGKAASDNTGAAPEVIDVTGKSETIPPVESSGGKNIDALKDVESTKKALSELVVQDYNAWDKIAFDEKKKMYKSDEQISEEYHKAKADGSNPELVKSVEDLLGVNGVTGKSGNIPAEDKSSLPLRDNKAIEDNDQLDKKIADSKTGQPFKDVLYRTANSEDINEHTGAFFSSSDFVDLLKQRSKKWKSHEGLFQGEKNKYEVTLNNPLKVQSKYEFLKGLTKSKDRNVRKEAQSILKNYEKTDNFEHDRSDKLIANEIKKMGHDGIISIKDREIQAFTKDSIKLLEKNTPSYEIDEYTLTRTNRLQEEVDLLDKAKSLVKSNVVSGINGEVLKESIKKGDEEFKNDLKAIYEQAANPKSKEAAIEIFGQDLIDTVNKIFGNEKAKTEIPIPTEETGTTETKPTENIPAAERGVAKVADEILNPEKGSSDTAPPTGETPLETKGTEGEPKVTSIKNEIVDKEREKRGLEPAFKAAKKEFGETWNNAMKVIEDNPEKGQELVAELKRKARPLSDEENAILLHRQIELQNAYDKVNNAINVAAEKGDNAAIQENRLRLAGISDALQDVYNVGRAAGTENARGLATRQMLAKEDFSLAAMETKKRAANSGRELTDEERAHIQGFSDRIKELEAKLDKLQKDIDEGKVKSTGKKTKKSSADFKSEREKISDSIKDKLKKARGEAGATILPYAKELIAIAPDVAKYVKSLVEEGVTKFDEVATRLFNELKPHIPDITENDAKDLIRGKYDQPLKQKILSPEEQKIKAEIERNKQNFRTELEKDRLKNAGALEKGLNFFVKWERAFKLSRAATLAKLSMAAIYRMGFTPVEEGIGAAWSAALPKALTDHAYREAGFNAKAEARALTQQFTQGMKDAAATINFKKGGKSDLEVLYGKEGTLPPEAADFLGHLHGAIKAPIKRAEFERSFEKRSAAMIAAGIGIDVTDPLVQTSIAASAYKDANRSIFMQDNLVSEGWNRVIRAMEQSKVAPNWGKAGAAIAKFLVPFVKVPTNIVGETITYTAGLPAGLARLGFAVSKGLENVSPEEKDIILRTLKKGSIGTAFLLLGYFNPQAVGGYYTGKRKDSDVDVGGLRLWGWDVPKWLVHNPLMETLQIGATIRRVSEEKNKNIGSGVMASLLGLSEEIPFVQTGGEVNKLFGTDQDRQDFLGRLAENTLIPGIVQEAAKWTDGNVKRKPETVGQNIEMGIPGLIKNVPFKRSYTSEDKKIPEFKYFVDKGLDLPYASAKQIEINNPKTGEKTKLNQYPEEKINEFYDTKKEFLQTELYQIENNETVYVDRYGEASTTPGQYKTKTTLDELNEKQLADILSIASRTATEKTKKKVFNQ